MTPTFEAPLMFFPTQPFMIYNDDKLLVSSPPLVPGTSPRRMLRGCAPLTLGDGRAPLTVRADSKRYAAKIAGRIENAVMGARDVPPESFRLQFNRFRETVLHDLCSTVDIEPCRLPPTYTIDTGTAFLTALTFTLYIMMRDPATSLVSLKCNATDDKLSVLITTSTERDKCSFRDFSEGLAALYSLAAKRMGITQTVRHEANFVYTCLSIPYRAVNIDELRAPDAFRYAVSEDSTPTSDLSFNSK